MTTKNNLLYLGLVFVIAVVSCLDVVCTCITKDAILFNEENPICLAVMERYGVHNFIIIKSITTTIVTVILIGMILSRRKFHQTNRITKGVIWPIFVFQVILFFYLILCGPLFFIRKEVAMLFGMLKGFYTDFY